uniref:Uncharacterized protein n=1 Tax=Anguilla anguilla TaxID=7936 RepID=A0A0E9VV07_ANGAN
MCANFCVCPVHASSLPIKSMCFHVYCC